MPSRFAVISWPLYEKSPQNGYLNLGEVYDTNTKLNLYNLTHDLNYFYPFTCFINKNKVICYNIEDFNFLQETYNLSYNIFYTKKIQSKTIVFRTPSLYDINSMKPFSLKLYNTVLPTISLTNNIWFIVLPHKNPIIRGKILDSCLELKNLNRKITFLLLGGKQGDNKTNTKSLMRRYLIKRGISSKDIIKSPYNFNDSLNFYLSIIGTDKLYIGTYSKNMSNIVNYIRKLRSQKEINKQIFYICD